MPQTCSVLLEGQRPEGNIEQLGVLFFNVYRGQSSILILTQCCQQTNVIGINQQYVGKCC